MALYITLVLIVLICLLLLTKITIRLQLVVDGWRPEVMVEISAFFRLVRRRIDWSMAAGNGKSTWWTSGLSHMELRRPAATDWSWHDGRALLYIIRRFLRHVAVEEWEMTTLFGTGQSHTTGLLSGWLWLLQTQAHALLFHSMKVRRPPRIFIRPDFQRRCLFWRIDCIASFRLGYAIIAGIRLFSYWLFRRRRRRQS